MLEVEVIDGDNNILDAGDTAEITVEIYNLGGADLYNLLPSISSSNANVTISNLAVLVDSLNSNTSENYVVCSVEVSDDAIAGDIIDFSFEITADNEFTFSEDFVLVVGLMIEDFESGDFTTFEWQQGGDEDWVIDDESHVGSYSAKSGEIGNNSTSSLSIELEVSSDGEISFWKKVSTELNYDYFKFSIDDNLQEQWSGDVDWSESVYSVNAGLHLFKWEYYKDGGVIGGGDCSWLDYIIFPPVAGEVGSNEDLLPNVTKLFGNYPNPFNPETTISFSVKQTSSFVNIYIFNIKGQKVRTIPVNLSGDEDKGSVTWNGTDKNNQPVASGIYFYQLNVDDKVIASKKCLLLK